MEPVTLLDVLRRRMVLIIAICLVTTVAGYAFSFLLPTKYSAVTVLLVRPQQPIKAGTEKESKEFLNFPIGGASAVGVCLAAVIFVLAFAINRFAERGAR